MNPLITNRPIINSLIPRRLIMNRTGLLSMVLYIAAAATTAPATAASVTTTTATAAPATAASVTTTAATAAPATTTSVTTTAATAAPATTTSVTTTSTTATAVTAASDISPAAATGTPPDLATRIERLEDIHDIQNVLGYYEEYQSALEFDRVWPLFALEHSDVRWEVGPGAYVGGVTVKGALMAQEKRPNDRQWLAIHRGEMHVHTLATPIIVIAGDGQTAKATFDSPGLETLSGTTHKPDARLGWCRYGVDLIKTPQGWKIWHMHVYGVIFSPATQSWVDAPGFPPKPKSTDVGGEWPPFTRPQTDVWIYTGKDIPPLLPRPPEPYRTFSETFSY